MGMAHRVNIELSGEDYWILRAKTTSAEEVRDVIREKVAREIEQRRGRHEGAPEAPGRSSPINISAAG